MTLSKGVILKIRLTLALFFLLAIGSVVMASKWQLFDNETYIAIANERYKDITLPALRGNILADDGSTLAFSEPRFDMYLWLPELERSEQRGYQTKEEFLTIISNIINIPYNDLSAKLNTGAWWIKLAENLDVETKNNLEDATIARNDSKLQGLQFEYVSKRVYPESRLASHVLGFVGANFTGDLVGVGGLEQYWEGSLKPQEGFESGEYDSFGNPITINGTEPLEAKQGVTIYTTINKNIQRILERKLLESINTFKAKTATGIIMDPKTGEIIALANMPDYDPNEYFKVEDSSVFSNMSISTPYEVGSIAKAFTLASAIDLETITSETQILPDGHKGCEIISPNPPQNASCFNQTSEFDCICTYNRKPVNNPITAKEAMINSDNIAFRHIALTMTYEDFYEKLKDFGVGVGTKIEIAGESTGIIKNPKYWNYADQAVYSYGHAYQITPLEAITGIGAIANYGQRMQPYIVKSVVDADGKETKFNPRVIAEPVSVSSAEQVSQIMHEVFTQNIPEKQYQPLKEYFLAMKSGTALVPNKDKAGYSSEINSTYVGFDASPERKFIMLIKLEEPQVGDLSFYNARIVWLDIFNEIKEYLAVPKYAG